jgi:hypothetical protein
LVQVEPQLARHHLGGHRLARAARPRRTAPCPLAAGERAVEAPLLQNPPALRHSVAEGVQLFERSIDRVGMIGGRDRAFYSGKHKAHGLNVQVIADPIGRLMWISPTLPGARHDMGAAREHALATSPR